MLLTPNIPKDPTELTQEWVTFALRSSGVLNGDNLVTAISDEGVEATAGQSGWYANLSIEYSTAAAKLPSRLFVKGMRSSSDLFSEGLANMFRHEIIFYSKIAPLTPIRVPRYYYGEIAEDGTKAIILLESIEQSSVGRMVDGLGFDDTDLLLQQLAVLHGNWWNSPAIDGFGWVSDGFTLVAKKYYAPGLPAVWERVKNERPELISPYARKLGELLVTRIPGIWSRLHDTPRSLLQMDAGVNNVAFETVHDNRQAVLFDWICGPGPVAWDLGLAICTGLREADHHRIPALIERYSDVLGDIGVRDFPVEQAFDVLRLGSLSAFAARLFALNPALSSDWDAPLSVMRRVGFERIGQVVEKMDSLSALSNITAN